MTFLAALAAGLAGVAAVLGWLSLQRAGQLPHELATLPDAVRREAELTRSATAQEVRGSRLELVQALAEARREQAQALERIRLDNDVRLEQMRATVQEKLDVTLGERFDASFKVVSERLESVQKGLGEMTVLAQGVGSLQRTLTNVKTRGIWGELQLDALLADLLTPGHYEKQFAVRPGAGELADFAIRLPGAEEGRPVWLALDAKAPLDVYERLLDAHEAGDPEQVRLAAKALEARVREEARSIGSKYVCPPHTTDFAVMYLPTEGLFAEVARNPGLVRELQTRHHVVVAGPTTLTALLSSLALGFRTLAIQERSSEVWRVLGQVRTEFERSEAVWQKMSRQLSTALRTADEAGVRHRAVVRTLREVEVLETAEPVESVTRALLSVDVTGPPSPAHLVGD